LLRQEYGEAEENRQNRRKEQDEKKAGMERIEAEFHAAVEKRAKADQQEQDKAFKMREQMIRKQQATEIKAAGDSVKAIEKEISALDKEKDKSDNKSLTSSDERMTSLGRSTGNVAQQQLEQQKKQSKLLELNQKLMEEVAKYAKLQAEKEDKVFEVAGSV